mmetsp:Transcript_4904/g.11734  ORF Transcript_4904/g.11734 Transcript_4904/m.11734 type:complete len:533 (+) Transcript_4904:60-1658(+)
MTLRQSDPPKLPASWLARDGAGGRALQAPRAHPRPFTGAGKGARGGGAPRRTALKNREKAPPVVSRGSPAKPPPRAQRRARRGLCPAPSRAARPPRALHARGGAPWAARAGPLGDELLGREVVEVEPRDELRGRLLPGLLLGVEALVVAGGHGLGLLEDDLGVADHVARLRLERLCAEREAALVLVLRDDHGLDLAVDLEDALDVGNVVVRDLADVEEARDAADVDKGAIGLDPADHALDHLAGVQVPHLGLDDGAAVGDDEPVLGLVHLEELEGDLGADHLLGEAAGGVRAGEEAAEALKGHEGAAPVDGEDLGRDGAVLGLHLTDTLPRARKLDAPDRQLQRAVLVLVRRDLELPVVTDAQDLLNVVHLLHRNLLVRQEGGGLATDVDEGPLDLKLDHLSHNNVPELKRRVELAHGRLEVGVVEAGGALDVAVADQRGGLGVLLAHLLELGELALTLGGGGHGEAEGGAGIAGGAEAGGRCRGEGTRGDEGVGGARARQHAQGDGGRGGGAAVGAVLAQQEHGRGGQAQF